MAYTTVNKDPTSSNSLLKVLGPALSSALPLVFLPLPPDTFRFFDFRLYSCSASHDGHARLVDWVVQQLPTCRTTQHTCNRSLQATDAFAICLLWCMVLCACLACLNMSGCLYTCPLRQPPTQSQTKIALHHEPAALLPLPPPKKMVTHRGPLPSSSDSTKVNSSSSSSMPNTS